MIDVPAARRPRPATDPSRTRSSIGMNEPGTQNTTSYRVPCDIDHHASIKDPHICFHSVAHHTYSSKANRLYLQLSIFPESYTALSLMVYLVW
jgi:hypothetical protein